MHAEPLELTVTPQPNATARLDDLLRLLREQLERVLAVAEPLRTTQRTTLELRERREVRELRVVQNVIVLVPPVLGPWAAVLDQQRRRPRRSALREQLHGV